jgi:hypothetical protein
MQLVECKPASSKHHNACVAPPPSPCSQLLDRANGWAAARGLSGHVRYLQANAVVSTEALLASYPGPVELLSIQYPDPQQRRQRHMVGRHLVETLARVLQPGGEQRRAARRAVIAWTCRRLAARGGGERA